MRLLSNLSISSFELEAYCSCADTECAVDGCRSGWSGVGLIGVGLVYVFKLTAHLTTDIQSQTPSIGVEHQSEYS